MKRAAANAGNAYHIIRNRKLILPMIGDILKNKYRLAPFTLLVMLLGLVYIIFPFDLLPDFIPFIGWIDDGMLLYLLFRQLRRETGRYALYRAASRGVPIEYGKQ